MISYLLFLGLVAAGPSPESDGLFPIPVPPIPSGCPSLPNLPGLPRIPIPGIPGCPYGPPLPHHTTKATSTVAPTSVVTSGVSSAASASVGPTSTAVAPVGPAGLPGSTLNQFPVEVFNMFQYLGVDTPYIQRTGYGIQAVTPDSCTVDQVQMLCRHGERYVSKGEFKDFGKLITKLQGGTPTGALEFISNYTLFMNSSQEGDITRDNQFGGIENSAALGQRFTLKYSNLVSKAAALNLTVYSSDASRVTDTAESFTTAMLGGSTDFTNVVLSEDTGFGANSFVIYDQCAGFDDVEDAQNDVATDFLGQTSQSIISRVSALAGTSLSTSDLFDLFQLCAYETQAVGGSDFCAIFTPDEFVTYSHYIDRATFLSIGPGNNVSAIAASAWAQAMSSLLSQDADPLYLSFVHHEFMATVLTLLKIEDDNQNLTATNIPQAYPWMSAQLLPMLANLVIERLSCGSDKFVRVVINEAVAALPSCQSGPGLSCPLNDFQALVASRVQQDQFEALCVPSGQPTALTVYTDKRGTA